MIFANLSFYLTIAIVAGLASALLWSWFHVNRRPNTKISQDDLETPGKNATYLSQIQQALDEQDFEFLRSSGPARLSRTVRKERAKVVLDYLTALHTDFQRMLRLARVIAVLSPEVAPAQEWERLRLSVSFTLKLEVTRLRVRFGWVALPQLQRVNRVVSGFAIRLEHAMTEMGERAALAAEMASFT